MDKAEYAKYFRDSAQTVSRCANTLHDLLTRFATQLSPEEQYAIARGRVALQEHAGRETRAAAEIEKELVA